eukprot:TRINITY_DN34962_c0_g1_i1.p1 TRINITY_DN34962_c0_g1~~TRINITY_DN34962_c0_g1_i1.p1  ORF type:complete len:244 (+),score=72.37 TRINITY_DN34962_c0_g1_i1:71-733(+)
MVSKPVLISGVLCGLVVLVCGWLGFSGYQLTEVAPCVEYAEEEMKKLPEKIKNLTSKVSDNLKLEAADVKEKMKAVKEKDGWNLKQAATDMMKVKEEGQTKTGEIKENGDKEKEQICDSVTDSASKCLSYLKGNVIYSIFAPSSIPSPDQVEGVIGQAKSALQSAGCKSSSSALAALSSPPAASRFPAALAALAALAAVIGGLVAQRAREVAIQQEPLLG